MRELPRAMLIDMDDTILSAHGHPEIAWNIVATEFAGELGQFSPRQVAIAIADTARQFWAVAGAEWRLKLAQGRAEGVRRGLAKLAGGAALPAHPSGPPPRGLPPYRARPSVCLPGAP